MRITNQFKEFYESEKSGGIALILCTIISLCLANSIFQTRYINFWHLNFVGISLEHWINDGLMALFFLLVSLELKREVFIGELSNFKNALLPVVAATGGMLVPAAIYLAFNFNSSTRSGAGIPMATDIAFAIGVLSLLGKRVPFSLKVFLTALAVIDDLGAIIVIVLFYSSALVWINLLIAFIILIVLYILNKLNIKNLIPYIIGGILMWYFMLHSGIHATIAGVLLATVIPFKKGDRKSASAILERYLNKPVSFFILPIFALANTAIIISTNWPNNFLENYSLGISLGLIIGKPLGILLFSFVSVSLGLCALPSDITWKHILGAGLLAGIGFTMSIFITLLAFNDTTIINNSKFIILSASFISGIIGYIYLSLILKPKKEVTVAE